MDLDKYRAKRDTINGAVLSVRVSAATIKGIERFSHDNALSFSEGVRCLLDVYTAKYVDMTPEKALNNLKSDLEYLENILKEAKK